MRAVEDVETALAGRESLLGVGVDDELLPAVIEARRRTDGGTWRLVCPPRVVDGLDRSLVLGTAVAEALSAGTLALRTADPSITPRGLFVVADAVHALTGPAGDRAVVSESDPEVIEGLRAAATSWFEGGDPATVGMPSRSRLIGSARTELDDRFADDLATVLASAEIGDLDRSGRVTDLTLLVALGARHDHLFSDVRTWADEVGIAARQRFTEDRRHLVDRGLIESVKVPMGVGHPNYRLRAVDDDLIHAPPAKLVPLLRTRLDDDRLDGDRDSGNATGTAGRGADGTPIWERRR
ncbi:transcriptional regulator TbsP domain-containing protein [Halorubrum sp. DTA98]|uniref:transcriptional regulator TbsP domain-containing protein n=1 Tax=Halorubrum sp. DTA98 TaxID=3402163 RepID=UPI003AAC86F3